MTALNNLTDLQLEILNHFWELGEATVNQLVGRLKEKHDFSRSTVATIVARLEKQGILDHQDGTAGFVYRPLVTRSEMRKSRVSQLLESLFGGKPSALVNHLIDSSADSDEIQEALKLIEEKEAGHDK